MIQQAQHCPSCGSEQTASRRQLFHRLMYGAQPQSAFRWYGDGDPKALPPKSLFVMFTILMVVLAVPAIGCWFLQHYSALTGLLLVAALTLAFLLVDVLLTYRRYKVWAGQWLCGCCRGVFAPAESQKTI